MALARSASGPGGLSINTAGANSLFGSNTSQAPASGGLFGTASKPAAGGLFGSSAATTAAAPQTQNLFGSNPTASAPAAGGLFGSTATNTQVPASGGLFGSAPTSTKPGGMFGSTASSQPAASGGLFGNQNTSSQPQPSGGLFGNTGTQSTQSGTTGGLFGNAGSTAQPAQSGGLFGKTGTQSNQAGTSGGLFGNGGATAQPAQGGGLFGGLNQTQDKPVSSSLFGGLNTQNQTPQPQQNGGLFGSSNNAVQPTSGLSLGQSLNQQQSLPGVRIDMTNIRSTTRYNDLHEDIQKGIEMYDAGILKAMKQCDDITAILPSLDEKLACIPNDVSFITSKLKGVDDSTREDAEAIHIAGGFISSDAENAKLSFRAIDNLSLPAQFHQRDQRNFLGAPGKTSSSNGDGASDIVSFFAQASDEMSSRLSIYQDRIRELEMHLRNVEATTVHQAQQLHSGGLRDGADPGQELRELVSVLRDFERAILQTAGNVGGAKEELQRLQLGGFEAFGRDDARVNGNGKRSGIY